MNSAAMSADFIIIGAGIIGLTIARELKQRQPHCSVIILEKEKKIAEHASGRNSGVLHAGFYYTKDSFKAKFTKQGNAALTNYCLEKKLPLNRCGKLVVARNADDLIAMQELLKRGAQNNIELEMISAERARSIEPRVKTHEYALFSPTTASVDPKLIMQTLLIDAKNENIVIHFGVEYLCFKNNKLYTNQGIYSCGYLINAAGLYADKVAKDFGFSNDYAILPFKGIYLYASNPVENLRTHIYPVPALNNPFLGVHFTLDVHGKTKIGPTAIPAFWREQYQGFSKFNVTEMAKIIWRELNLFLNAGFDFRGLAWNEIKKYNRNTLIKHANELADMSKKSEFYAWGNPGIRAQLLNIKTKRLEMDFIMEGDKRSFHVLNAVSPAFTGSIPFASYVVDQIQERLE